MYFVTWFILKWAKNAKISFFIILNPKQHSKLFLQKLKFFIFSLHFYF